MCARMRVCALTCVSVRACAHHSVRPSARSPARLSVRLHTHACSWLQINAEERERLREELQRDREVPRHARIDATMCT